MDMRGELDRIHMPEGAGEHAEGLLRILQRIPPGWGRWISNGPGWYPLLIALDQELAAVDPGYRVHQVKEKFGELRVYVEPGPSCCEKWTEAHPAPPDPDEAALAAWNERFSREHEATPEHRQASEQRARVATQMQEIIARYEDLAALTPPEGDGPVNARETRSKRPPGTSSSPSWRCSPASRWKRS